MKTQKSPTTTTMLFREPEYVNWQEFYGFRKVICSFGFNIKNIPLYHTTLHNYTVLALIKHCDIMQTYSVGQRCPWYGCIPQFYYIYGNSLLLWVESHTLSVWPKTKQWNVCMKIFSWEKKRQTRCQREKQFQLLFSDVAHTPCSANCKTKKQHTVRLSGWNPEAISNIWLLFCLLHVSNSVKTGADYARRNRKSQSCRIHR